MLNETGHVRSSIFSSFLSILTLDQLTVVEPFGGASDYDVSESHTVYAAKYRDLP